MGEDRKGYSRLYSYQVKSCSASEPGCRILRRPPTLKISQILPPPSSQTRGIAVGSGGPKPEIDLTEAFWSNRGLLGTG